MIVSSCILEIPNVRFDTCSCSLALLRGGERPAVPGSPRERRGHVYQCGLSAGPISPVECSHPTMLIFRAVPCLSGSPGGKVLRLVVHGFCSKIDRSNVRETAADTG